MYVLQGCCSTCLPAVAQATSTAGRHRMYVRPTRMLFDVHRVYVRATRMLFDVHRVYVRATRMLFDVHRVYVRPTRMLFDVHRMYVRPTRMLFDVHRVYVRPTRMLFDVHRVYVHPTRTLPDIQRTFVCSPRILLHNLTGLTGTLSLKHGGGAICSFKKLLSCFCLIALQLLNLLELVYINLILRSSAGNFRKNEVIQMNKRYLESFQFGN
jgi:hypothetical protein